MRIPSQVALEVHLKYLPAPVSRQASQLRGGRAGNTCCPQQQSSKRRALLYHGGVLRLVEEQQVEQEQEQEQVLRSWCMWTWTARQGALSW